MELLDTTKPVGIFVYLKNFCKKIIPQNNSFVPRKSGFIPRMEMQLMFSSLYVRNSWRRGLMVV